MAARLARISHRVTAAAAQCSALTGVRSVGQLDLVSTTPARPSVVNASHHTTLNSLAARPCEKFGLACLLRVLPWLLAAMLLSACGGTSNLAPPSPLPKLENNLPVEKVWRQHATRGVGKYYLKLRPYVAKARVFAADYKGRVVAHRMENGKRIWQVETGQPITAGVNGGEGVIVVGAESGDLIGLSADSGDQRWKQHLNSQVMAVSSVSQGVLVARSGDGYIYGISADSGDILWKLLKRTPALSLHLQSEPLLTHGVAFIGLDNGELIMVSLLEGRVLWEKVVALGRGSTELDRMVDIDGQLAFSDGVIYVATYQGKVAAIDAARARVLWLEDFSTVNGLAVDDKALYVTDEDSVVWARDKRTGAALWKQEALKFRRLTAPVVWQSRVVVGDFEGYIHFLNEDSGRLEGRVRADHKGVLSAPLPVDDSLIVLGQGGKLSRWRLPAE